MRRTEKVTAALAAVATGRVKHVHPFTWTIAGDIAADDLLLLGIAQTPLSRNVFERLAREGYIRVEANSPEYARPVVLTEKGKAI